MDYTIKESPFNSVKHELESLGVRANKLNRHNDFYEIRHLVDNLKEQFFLAYKSGQVFTD
jgi:hypothetical protein